MTQTAKKELSARERRAIAGLLAEPTIREAARVSGVSRKTLYEYLGRPHFVEALEWARAEARRMSAARLDALLTQALDVIGLDMTPGARPEFRLRAAGMVLRHIAGLGEYLELLERVEALEARIAEGKR